MTIDRELIKQAIKQAMSDRPFLLLAILIIALSFIYSIAIALTVHSSDVTLYSRYTAFGEAHFYKNHWQYLLNFVAFGPIVGLTHCVLMVKLYSMERRQTALLVGWLGVTIITIAFVYSTSVIGLGYAA